MDEKIQHSHRNYLLFNGIKEEKDENTDTMKEEIDIEIFSNDLDRLHRTGKPKTQKKERPTIVIFLRYIFRHNIFKNNKLLK